MFTFELSWSKTKFGEAKIITNLRADLIALKADMEKSTSPVFSKRSYDIQPVNVVVNPTPDLSVTNPINACEPNTVDITQGVTDNNNTNGTYTYWQDANLTIPVADERAIDVSGTYHIQSQTAAGCTDTDTVMVIIEPLPQFTVSDSAVCPGGIITMNITPLNQYDEDSYDWYTDSLGGTLVHTGGNFTTQQLTQSVTYWVEPSRGCKDTRVRVDLVVHPLPVADFVSDQSVIEDIDTIVNFTDLSTGAVSGIWDFGDGTVDPYTPGYNPAHLYLIQPGDIPDDYTITLDVVSQHGCPASADMIIPVELKWAIYIPKAFTPGDYNGVNDGFTPKGFGIVEIKMWIFNRWGDNIFYSDEWGEEWDGNDHMYKGDNNYLTSPELVKQDTYVYKVEIINVFGEKHIYIGEVNLIK